jgi:uncharacterized protein (DUF1810 family)
MRAIGCAPQGQEAARLEQLHLSPAKKDVFDEALKKSGQSKHGVLWDKMEDKMTGLLTRTLLIGDAFDAWVEWTVREIRVEMLFGKAVQRMAHQLCWSVFNNWLLRTFKMKRFRVVVARCEYRIQGRAFNSWRLNAHVTRAARELGAASAEALKHMNESQQRTVKAALQKMWKQVATKVMTRWSSFVKEKIENRYRMTKVIKRVANLKMAAAMTSWTAMVSEKQSMRNKMAKVIKRVANMKAAAALSAWVTMAEGKKTMRDRMMKVIKRVANLKIAAAMTSWTAMVSEKQSMRNKMAKVIKRVANMKAAAALSAWVTMAEGKKTMRDRMTKVIKRVANLKVAAAMTSWTAMVSEKQSMRNKMAKVIKRVANMKAAAALARWVDMVVEAHTMRDRMTKVIKRVANLKLGCALKAWTCMVQMAKQQRMREQMENSNAELDRVKAELAVYKAAQAAFEERLDSLQGLPDFAIGAERLRKKGTRTPSPRSIGSPIPGRTVRENERSILRARAAAKSPN